MQVEAKRIVSEIIFFIRRLIFDESLPGLKFAVCSGMLEMRSPDETDATPEHKKFRVPSSGFRVRDIQTRKPKRETRNSKLETRNSELLFEAIQGLRFVVERVEHG